MSQLQLATQHVPFLCSRKLFTVSGQNSFRSSLLFWLKWPFSSPAFLSLLVRVTLKDSFCHVQRVNWLELIDLYLWWSSGRQGAIQGYKGQLLVFWSWEVCGTSSALSVWNLPPILLDSCVVYLKIFCGKSWCGVTNGTLLLGAAGPPNCCMWR